MHTGNAGHRQWILLVAVTLAALHLSNGIVSAQQAKERKNIDDLSAQELAAYRHAVNRIMKSTDPQNNYVYHANLHNLFSSNPPHGCEHGNDLFFPWHRYHLHHFEIALQNSDPNHPTLSTKDVTIPYWDWTKQASGKRFPKSFEEELDASMAANPLYYDFRNTAPAAPIFDAAYMTGIVKTNSDWNTFAGGPVNVNEFYGAFESPSHNTMHGSYIGGSMADPSEAAMDPIYWSFHAFIDMQWDRWQKVHNNTPPTSQSETLRGFPNAPTVAQTVNVQDLGYFYTHTPESIEPLPEPEAVPELMPRVFPLKSTIAEAESTVATWGGKGPFTFELPSIDHPFRRVDLWLDQVRIPQTLSYRMDVFLHPAGRMYDESHKVGFLYVWKGHTKLGGQAHQHNGNFYLTITERLRKALKDNPNGKLAVTLVVHAVPLPAHPETKSQRTTLPLDREVQFDEVQLLLDKGGPFQKDARKVHAHEH